MDTVCRVCWVILLVTAVIVKDSAARFIYGREAKKLCQAYSKVCPRGKVCAIQILVISGRTIKFPVCVHQFEVKVRSPVCLVAPSPGRCAANFRRWYFNVHMAACSWFTYGGCGGNDNNFRSREECETMCVVRIDEDDASNDVIATIPPDPLKLLHGDEHRQQNRHHFSPDSTRASTPHYSHPSGGQHTTTTHRNSFHSSYGQSSTPNNDADDAIYSEHRTSHRDQRREGWSFGSAETPSPHTSLTPTTAHLHRPNVRDEHDLGTVEPPVELRRPSAGNSRRIVQRPRPVYHRDHSAAVGPKALHAQERNGRNMPDLPIKASELSDKIRGWRKFSDRRLTNFSDKTRSLRENRDVEAMSDDTTGRPVTSLARGQSRIPHRVLSVLNRGSHQANRPGPLPAHNDVRAALTSEVSSSYAPDANETVRRFTSRRRLRGRRRRRINRHVNRRRSRRRRHRNQRRHGRRNRTRQGRKHWKNQVTSWSSVAESQGKRAGNSDPTRSPQASPYGPHWAGPQLAEFRQNTAYFWPARSQNKDNNDDNDDNDDNENNEDNDQTHRQSRAGKRKRWRGRRKGKRRGRRGRQGRREFRRADRGRNTSSVQGEGQYYDRIPLFTLLDKPLKDTDAAQ